MMHSDTDYIDPRGTRFAAFLIFIGALAAWLTTSWWVAGALGLILLTGAAGGFRFNLIANFYHHTVRHLMGPPRYWEPDQPSRFTQLLGALILLAASLLFYGGKTEIGSHLVAVVAVFALLNGVIDFCIGCKLYGLFNRTPGRRHHHRGSRPLDLNLETELHASK